MSRARSEPSPHSNPQVRKFEMTTPKPEHRSGWRQVAGACAAMLITAACTPAGTSAPAPAPVPAAVPTPVAPTPAALPVETVVATAPAAPAAATIPAPAATAPVGVRPPAPPPASPATLSPPTPPIPPATVIPARSGLPTGPGRETVQQLCTSCHAIGMVTANGRTSDGWAELIERMMGLGLEASDEDLQTVHAYLTREFPPRRAN